MRSIKLLLLFRIRKNCVSSVKLSVIGIKGLINLLAPNYDYSGRTAPLTSKCCILYIYSTNIDTEYFKHGTYSPLFFLQNADFFINLTHLFPVLFTFYIQDVLKLKKNNNSGAKRLITEINILRCMVSKTSNFPYLLFLLFTKQVY